MTALHQSDPPRMVVYPKDVVKITGLKYSACARLLQKIKQNSGWPVTHLVTAEEFSIYMGMNEEKVKEFLIR